MKKEHMVKNFGFKLINKQFDDPQNPDYYTFKGLASTFGNVDLQGEVVVRGAFKQTIKDWKKLDRDLPMLWQHNRDEPIGVFKNLKETKEGLEVTGYFPTARKDSFVEERVIPQLEIGSIRTMSISGWKKNYTIDDDTDIWYLNELDLNEISLVTSPANPLAVITSLKAQDLEKYDIRNLEKMLTKSGVTFSQSLAKKIISMLKNSYRDVADTGKRDVVEDDLSNNDKNDILDKLNEILGV